MITLDELKIFLGIDLSDTSNDAFLQSIIDDVSVTVNTYCKRTFQADDYIEEKDGHGERFTSVKNYPLNTITSIKFRESTDYSLGFTGTIEPKNYSFKQNGEIYINYNLPRGYNFIEITYNGGYTVIPEDVKLGVKKICEGLYRQNQAEGITSESVDGTSIKFVDYSKEKIENTMRIFDNYINYEV